MLVSPLPVCGGPNMLCSTFHLMLWGRYRVNADGSWAEALRRWSQTSTWSGTKSAPWRRRKRRWPGCWTSEHHVHRPQADFTSPVVQTERRKQPARFGCVHRQVSEVVGVETPWTASMVWSQRRPGSRLFGSGRNMKSTGCPGGPAGVSRCRWSVLPKQRHGLESSMSNHDRTLRIRDQYVPRKPVALISGVNVAAGSAPSGRPINDTDSTIGNGSMLSAGRTAWRTAQSVDLEGSLEHKFHLYIHKEQIHYV